MPDIFYYETGSTRAPYNLALEEVLATAVGGGFDGCFLLWQNSPAVIIGRYQNAMSEVNLPELKTRGVDLVRRMTGGGAVYHDLGNLNFSFILPQSGGQKYQTAEMLAPLIEYYDKAFGLKVVMEGRNDLTVPGRGKFSGLAGRRLPGGWQLHGTLLYDVDLSVLEKVLLVDPAKYRGKGVASVRTRVANLKPFINVPLADMWAGIRDAYGYQASELPAELAAKADELSRTKYSQTSWNVGQSPPGDATLKSRFPFGSLELRLSVRKNVVVEAALTGDFLTPSDLPEPVSVDVLAAALLGLPADDQEKWARAWGVVELGKVFGGQVDQEEILAWLRGA